MTPTSNDDLTVALRITEEAVTRGAFGAPTFFVMFWGQDRLDFVGKDRPVGDSR